jgi:MFS transporter, FHS family, glucose/mannose:H+ symporter
MHPPVATASLSVALTGITSIMIGSLLPSIVGDLHLTSIQTGILTGCPGFGYLVGVLLSGFLGDRVGYQLFWRLGAIAGFLALVGVALAPSFGLTLIAAGAIGLVPGFFDGSINPLLVSLAKDRPAGILNRVHMFFGVGVTVGPLLVGLALYYGLGWRWQFCLAATLAIVVLIAVLRLSIQKGPTPRPALNTLLRSRPLVYSIIAAAMYGGLEVVMLSWTVLYLNRVRSIIPSSASLAVSLFGLTLMIGRFTASRIAEQIGYRRLVVGGGVAAALGLVLLVILPGQILPWLGIAVTGLAMSGIFLTLTAEVNSESPGLGGTVTALISAASGLGKLALPLAIGQMAQSLGLASGLLLGAICGLVLALAYARRMSVPA